MTFEIGKCWDCPVPLITLLLQVVGGLAAVSLGMLLIRGRPLARTVGILTLVLASFWYFFVVMGILRFGVSWNGAVMTTDQLATWRMMRVADISLVVTWLLATFVAIRRLRHQPSSVV